MFSIDDSEGMQSMLHYHLDLVTVAAGVSVTESITVDRHRYCAEVMRAELADSFALLGYTFREEVIESDTGKSEVVFDFCYPGTTVGFGIYDCACPEGEKRIMDHIMAATSPLN